MERGLKKEKYTKNHEHIEESKIKYNTNVMTYLYFTLIYYQ